jgi:Tfp pilus assembly protein PilE
MIDFNVDLKVDSKVEIRVQAAMVKMQRELEELIRQETAKAAPPPMKSSPPLKAERPYIGSISVTRGGPSLFKGVEIKADKKKTVLKSIKLTMQGGQQQIV